MKKDGKHEDNPLLFIPIETKVREFHGKLLFGLAAIERGFNVVIGGQEMLRSKVHQFERGLYVDKSIVAPKSKWFRKCHSIGCRVASWDEEGLLYFDDETYHHLRLGKQSMDQIRLFVTWGQEHTSTILKKFPAVEDKLFPAGNPRFDLLRPELRSFFDERVQTINDQYGDLILINTNFGFYNHFNGVEYSRKVLQQYPIAKRQPDFFDGWIEAQKIMFDRFVVLVSKLSSDFPKHTIIVRPHPSEDRSTWVDRTSSLPNVVVNAEGNVIEWILASKVLVHFNCTTAIEAFLMDIPAIAYQAHDIGPYEQQLPNALSIQTGNYRELLNLVQGIIDGEKHFIKTTEQKQIADRFITGITGPYSADRIAEAMVSVAYKGKRKRTIAQQTAVWWTSFWLWGRKIKNGRGTVNYYDRQKFPGIDQSELQSCIERFSSITGRFQNIEIEPVGESCFMMYQNNP